MATGGFGVRLARERGLLLRANEWSEGDGLAYGVARGASVTAGLDEFYGRALPAEVDERDYVSAAQVYARYALVLDDEGRDLGDAAWHESDLVQRLPGGRAWYVVDARTLRQPVRERTVADLVDAARAVGGDVRSADELPFALSESPKLVEPPFVAVRVRAAVTHTIGGLRIDERARVLDGDGRPIAGLHAAGADAGGIFTGGYGSGLAAALVFGRIAAETALAARPAACMRSDACRPGSGDGPTLLTRRSVSPASTVDPGMGASPSRHCSVQPAGDQTNRRWPGLLS